MRPCPQETLASFDRIMSTQRQAVFGQVIKELRPLCKDLQDYLPSCLEERVIFDDHVLYSSDAVFSVFNQIRGIFRNSCVRRKKVIELLIKCCNSVGIYPQPGVHDDTYIKELWELISNHYTDKKPELTKQVEHSLWECRFFFPSLRVEPLTKLDTVLDLDQEIHTIEDIKLKYEGVLGRWGLLESGTSSYSERVRGWSDSSNDYHMRFIAYSWYYDCVIKTKPITECYKNSTPEFKDHIRKEFDAHIKAMKDLHPDITKEVEGEEDKKAFSGFTQVTDDEYYAWYVRRDRSRIGMQAHLRLGEPPQEVDGMCCGDIFDLLCVIHKLKSLQRKLDGEMIDIIHDWLYFLGLSEVIKIMGKEIEWSEADLAELQDGIIKAWIKKQIPTLPITEKATFFDKLPKGFDPQINMSNLNILIRSCVDEKRYDELMAMVFYYSYYQTNLNGDKIIDSYYSFEVFRKYVNNNLDFLQQKINSLLDDKSKQGDDLQHNDTTFLANLFEDVRKRISVLTPEEFTDQVVDAGHDGDRKFVCEWRKEYHVCRPCLTCFSPSIAKQVSGISELVDKLVETRETHSSGRVATFFRSNLGVRRWKAFKSLLGPEFSNHMLAGIEVMEENEAKDCIYRAIRLHQLTKDCQTLPPTSFCQIS